MKNKKQSFVEFCGTLSGYRLFTLQGLEIPKYQVYWGLYKIENLILKER